MFSETHFTFSGRLIVNVILQCGTNAVLIRSVPRKGQNRVHALYFESKDKPFWVSGGGDDRSKLNSGDCIVTHSSEKFNLASESTGVWFCWLFLHFSFL